MTFICLVSTKCLVLWRVSIKHRTEYKHFQTPFVLAKYKITAQLIIIPKIHCKKEVLCTMEGYNLNGTGHKSKWLLTMEDLLEIITFQHRPKG